MCVRVCSMHSTYVPQYFNCSQISVFVFLMWNFDTENFIIFKTMISTKFDFAIQSDLLINHQQIGR